LAFDPIFKIIEGISDQFFPHTYYNYNITQGTQYGYHALAIDDARKSFRPEVWIEKGRDPSTVEQVWFAGVHSNVGGGYPRAGLSDVALDWMMQKAAARGLTFIDGTAETVRMAANEQGKLYDSRDGLGMYYRYQPRMITELCKSTNKKTFGEDKLLGPVKIHNTVFKRVERGTARYVPSFIPAVFDVVKTLDSSSRSITLEEESWQKAQQEVNSWVKKQQYLYHAFVEVTFFLIVCSLLLWLWPPEIVTQLQLDCCGDVSSLCDLPSVAKVLYYIFPSLFENFITFVVCAYSIIFIVMVAVLAGMYVLRSAFRKGLAEAQETCRKLLFERVLREQAD